MASQTVPPISHILYFVPDSKGCELAVNIVKQYPSLRKEIHLQDIKLIEKPAWLRGVPVLAKVSSREIWEGSAAIEQLHYLAGYYSALHTVSMTSSQPWASYQTNLALPQPVATQVSSQSPLSVSSSSPPPPIPITNPSPVVQPPSVPLSPPPSISTPLPSPSQPQVTLQRPLVQTPNRTESDPNDPNKIQPIPLPDDRRPQQEIALPPPPENIKKHSVQPTPPDASPQTVTNPPPQPQSISSSQSSQSSRQSSRQPLANSSTVQPPQPLVKTSEPVDHVALVFTPDELETIQKVMFKPKTVNKRPNAHGSDEVFHVDETLVEELRGRGRDANSLPSSDIPNVREFPVSERTHSTIIQKDDGGNNEEIQPTSA